jgi:hypothetical protein
MKLALNVKSVVLTFIETKFPLALNGVQKPKNVWERNVGISLRISKKRGLKWLIKL